METIVIDLVVLAMMFAMFAKMIDAGVWRSLKQAVAGPPTPTEIVERRLRELGVREGILYSDALETALRFEVAPSRVHQIHFDRLYEQLCRAEDANVRLSRQQQLQYAAARNNHTPVQFLAGLAS